MIGLFHITWTVQEVNGVHWVFIKKCSKIFCYDYWLQLIGVNYRIKNMLYWMNSISNNNDIGNVMTLSLAQIVTQAKTWVRVKDMINW